MVMGGICMGTGNGRMYCEYTKLPINRFTKAIWFGPMFVYWEYGTHTYLSMC